jgi:hypothetical protein
MKVLAPAVDLRLVVAAVTHRAERQGYILPRQVREELTKAGAATELWKDVVKAVNTLAYRRGRYYYVKPVSPSRQLLEDRNQEIREAVHELVLLFKREAARQERRESDRILFVQPVKVIGGELGEHQVLTRDISGAGIRLLGCRELLGQKLCVTIPAPSGPAQTFLIRVVWTCRVGDDLYENGAVFLELVKDGNQPPLRIKPEQG